MTVYGTPNTVLLPIYQTMVTGEKLKQAGFPCHQHSEYSLATKAEKGMPGPPTRSVPVASRPWKKMEGISHVKV